MEYMRTLPDKAFDLAVVDPPYGINFSGKSDKHDGIVGGAGAASNRHYHIFDDSKPPGADYFSELRRVSAAQIIFGGNYFADFLPPTACWLVWDKRCHDNMRNNFADCELAWGSPQLGPARVFRFVWMGMIQGGSGREERFHPTQKPVELYKWIFSRFAKPGDRILDTHLGSGSSRIAAYDLGLDFVGCELDPVYYKLEEERFARHSQQLNLFID